VFEKLWIEGLLPATRKKTRPPEGQLPKNLSQLFCSTITTALIIKSCKIRALYSRIQSKVVTVDSRLLSKVNHLWVLTVPMVGDYVGIPDFVVFYDCYIIP
jgi:hypothetical protein